MNEKIKVFLPYLIIIVAVVFIKAFIVTPIRVNGSSMEPTLHQKDIMLLNKAAYYFSSPKRFVIVVVDMPDEYLIKRIIGLPGESIEYKDNTLYVDGKEIKEPISNLETDDFNIEELGSDKVPDNCYLVMGDNRKNSLDSRELGFIKEEQILGRTSFILLPFNRFGNVE